MYYPALEIAQVTSALGSCQYLPASAYHAAHELLGLALAKEDDLDANGYAMALVRFSMNYGLSGTPQLRSSLSLACGTALALLSEEDRLGRPRGRVRDALKIQLAAFQLGKDMNEAAIEAFDALRLKTPMSYDTASGYFGEPLTLLAPGGRLTIDFVGSTITPAHEYFSLDFTPERPGATPYGDRFESLERARNWAIVQLRRPPIPLRNGYARL